MANILITGASRGLGVEMAAEALERGHRVIAGVRDIATQGKLAALAEQYGSQLELAKLDVSDEAGLADLAASLKQQGRSLGAIINNAAILEARNTSIEELDMNEVLKSFDINLFGPMRVVKHFLSLVTEPNGAIINISSEAGSISNAYPGDYPYGISKTALNMFTQQLLSAVKKQGIQVLSVHPGWMKTDMGGENAPTNPRQSAKGILDLAEGRIVPQGKFNFVDYTGKEMPI
ncbi:SDR family oxidoreductase [Paenibacillus glycanilyticus]|uniref:SDR family oxidoreductase n=1 Tax=Paenibacillus glycanilyticus TaxID=126569 RepID=UPI00203C993F|nr:SDR family oxidoreductase [Paenibacillus glycanilyticus]MCM3629455.1 SDR family oxidoreductase [Paenibacillus glycanilyticus]